MELDFHRDKPPIYSNERPADDMLAGFVHVAPSVFMAMESVTVST